MGSCDSLYVTMVAIFLSLGAFTCGFHIVATNGIQNYDGFLEFFGLGNSSANATCTETSDIDDYGKFILGVFVSFINLGGAIGTVLAGKPTDFLGRKLTIMLTAVLMVLGIAIQASTVQGAVWMFAIGRFIAGMGYGAYYVAGPLYLVEVSPKRIRGILTSFIGPGVTLGSLFGHITNNQLFDKPFGWRLYRVILLLQAAIFLVGLFFLPRTPRWLMLRGREHEAREVLKGRMFRGNKDEIIKEIKEVMETQTKRGFIQDIKVIIKWTNLKRIILCLILNVLTSACGTTFIYYSETLFCSLGMTPFVASLISSSLTLFGTILTTIFIDKLGRKPVLVGGGFLMCSIAVTAATLVYVYDLEEKVNPVVSFVVVGLVCLFLLVYAATWYVTPWIVTSEVFPLEGRGVSTALSSSVNWLNSYVYTLAFPFILTGLKLFGTIYLFASINLCAGLFYLFLLPETKGISLEAMEKLFAKPWLERVGLCQCSKSRRTKDTAVASTDDSNVNPVAVSKANGVTDLSTEQRNGGTEFPVEDSKEWEDYWERYEAENKRQGLETSV